VNYLLDTCVLSEFTKRQPDVGVVHWVGEADEAGLFLSVLSIGEIKHGIARLPASPRKDELDAWLSDELLPRFKSRLLVLDAETMLLWGGLVSRLRQAGTPIPVMDSLIAATALYHHLTLVTRNEADFGPADVPVINPWQ
jgi:predicted nucleic acid-binding protein